MSGTEAFAVLGLISSVMDIIETSRQLYDAATSAAGLHEAFRAVAIDVPLVLNILRDCKRIQEQADRELRESKDATRIRELEESAQAVAPVLEACREDATQLRAIFDKVVPGEKASRAERYQKAAQAVMPGKKRRVEELMKDMLEKLQLLHTNQFFRMATESRARDLDGAIQRLATLPPSLPDGAAGRVDYHVAGSMNLNAGAGTQSVYSQTGGSNNRQFHAETMNFGND